jgi:hypothetical protein
VKAYVLQSKPASTLHYEVRDVITEIRQRVQTHWINRLMTQKQLLKISVKKLYNFFIVLTWLTSIWPNLVYIFTANNTNNKTSSCKCRIFFWINYILESVTCYFQLLTRTVNTWCYMTSSVSFTSWYIIRPAFSYSRFFQSNPYLSYNKKSFTLHTIHYELVKFQLQSDLGGLVPHMRYHLITQVVTNFVLL